MQTKTYFSTSVPAALEVARKELGPDALLVGSRPAPAEVRAFGRLEVTFAFDERRPEAPAPMAPARQNELDDLRKQIAALRDEVGSTRPTPLPAFAEHLRVASGDVDRRVNEWEPLVERLTVGGMSRTYAREVVMAASRGTAGMGSVAAQLAGKITVTPFPEMRPGESRCLALIGPSGRGKSTSLVKIAFRYGLARRVPVRIYSAGAHGVGGQEQMARFASILGVPFQAFESLESLHLALSGDSWRGLVLIDTPALSREDTAEMSSMAAFFERRPEIEKHLVLRADSRIAELMHTVAVFAGLKPSRILPTGLDEALSLGALAEVLGRAGIPCTLAGTGRKIPDDLEEADAMKWARTVCSGLDFAAAAAA